MGSHPPTSIGLCLSGGGFRASLFHLGVLRYLAEAGQLSNVSVISTVSGGSIVGAFLATRWGEMQEAGHSLDAFMSEVFNPFTRQVTTHNLRNRWLLLLLPTLPLLLGIRFTWIKIWAWYFDRWFYGGGHRKMHELPEGLELVINATSLSSAKAYRFARDFWGDDQGYTEKEPNNGHPVRVSEAVTASSAHLPMHIDEINSGAERGLWFIDGGVFDNTGLDWFLNWENKQRPKSAVKPSFLIACEASAELHPWRWGWRRYIPLYRMTRVLGRVKSIQNEQTRRTRKDWFIDRIKHRINEVDGIIISIDVVARQLREARKRSDYEDLLAHSLSQVLVERVRAIRTDLDCFLKEEAELLAYHGYWLTHVYSKTFHESTHINGRPLVVPDPSWKIEFSDPEIARFLDALRRCDKRFDPRRRLL